MPPIAPCRKNERLGRYTCQVLGAVPERTCDRMVVLSSIGVASLSVVSGHAARPAYQVALRRPSVILRSRSCVTLDWGPAPRERPSPSPRGGGKGEPPSPRPRPLPCAPPTGWTGAATAGPWRGR